MRSEVVLTVKQRWLALVCTAATIIVAVFGLAAVIHSVFGVSGGERVAWLSFAGVLLRVAWDEIMSHPSAGGGEGES